MFILAGMSVRGEVLFCPETKGHIFMLSMIKGKSCLHFNELIHSKTCSTDYTGQLVRPYGQSLVLQHDEKMSYNMNHIFNLFNDYS